MKKHTLIFFLIILVFAGTSAFAGITVTSPGNGSTVGSSVTFVAKGTTPCPKGVASMGIYPAPYQLA